MIDLAIEIAKNAHKGQIDKADEEYIKHSLYVTSLMKSENEKTVALLHDVVEDSDITIADLIDSVLPKDIIIALKLLTKSDDIEYCNYIKKIESNELAQAVKIADLVHNLDLTRLKKITEKDLLRVKKCKKALEYLI